MAKNKPKTRKSAAKRFKVSPKGKVLNRGQGFRHLRGKKNKSWLRRKKKTLEVVGRMKRKVLMMLGKK
ncbi:50S ribosomal protein L35 [Candidatus Roizmanbacteria bacterium CG_4_9_14_3_um_filter_33_18]|uniref:50S ribosomal protein L35 n=3 Tax=Candidatus Roizmaniibacteriota TaxID=1752723 RepID=A0A2M7U9L2_9BACT|nr:MAG: 50S ribosomal protein L35 [Candidatus Roizmanbacteria bacterium CG22_combo_CG10-13_8_21_14_all_34_12]PIZ67917.1 MAG: 50S ribosomal protein L35 [Candidatus Roizmanbacteria bacterium CG_4_10_14_0_2_um_filter_33_96]PJA55622.1 MAG: 50S ribosomal protein L35 [Candidatus Roizmanbacteria bacterium CG_4_9_14_3_um_filter_33_18]